MFAVCNSLIDRRQLLLGGVSSAGLALLSCRSDSTNASKLEYQTPWPIFLTQAEALTRSAVKRGPRAERSHLRALALELATARVPPADSIGFPKAPKQTILHRREHLVVARYTLGPNQVIPAHDHQGYNGLTRVVRGTLLARTFETVETTIPIESEWELRLKAIDREWLGTSEMAAITLSGANIHQLQAGPSGAEFVDVFTIYESPPRSRTIEIDHESRGHTTARFAT